MMVEPGFGSAAAVFLLPPASQRRQYDISQTGLLSNPTSHFVPVHPRHPDVHEHNFRAGENTQSRVYLGIHWEFDAAEGIRSGDGIGDYVFTHSLTPLHGPRPVAPRSLDPYAQIGLSVLLEEVAPHGGLHIPMPPGQLNFGSNLTGTLRFLGGDPKIVWTTLGLTPPKTPTPHNAAAATKLVAQISKTAEAADHAAAHAPDQANQLIGKLFSSLGSLDL